MVGKCRRGIIHVFLGNYISVKLFKGKKHYSGKEEHRNLKIQPHCVKTIREAITYKIVN
jgi:hypothetical protein